MASQSLTVILPAEVVALLGPPDVAAARARMASVAELLRDGSISQGQAAALLGMTHWDVLDLMPRYGVASGTETPEEAQRDVENARGTDPGR